MFKCTNYNFHSFEHKVAVNCSAAGAGRGSSGVRISEFTPNF